MSFSQLGIGTVAGTGVANNIVNQPRPQTIHEDIHAVRYLYGAGLLLPQVNARTTGMQTGYVPQGCLVTFRDFNLKEDNFNLSQEDLEAMVTISALEAATNALDELGAPGAILVDALTGLDDNQKLEALWAIVHPAFADIGYECPEGMQICPTCRIELLKDEFINERIETLAPQLGVSEFLCHTVVATLRRQNQTLLTHYAKQWTIFRQELEQAKTGKNGALRTLFPEHLYIRACLHESSPEEREAQIASAYGAEQSKAFVEASNQNAAAMREVIQAVKGGSDDKILALMEQQAETNKILLAMLQNQVPAAATATPEKPEMKNSPKNK